MNETGLSCVDSIRIFHDFEIVTSLHEDGCSKPLLFCPWIGFRSPIIALSKNSFLPEDEELTVLQRFVRDFVLSLKGSSLAKMHILSQCPPSWFYFNDFRRGATITFNKCPLLGGWRFQIVYDGYCASDFAPSSRCRENFDIVGLLAYIDKRRKIEKAMNQVVSRYLSRQGQTWTIEQFAIDEKIVRSLGYDSIIVLNTAAESFDPYISVFPWHDFWVNYVRCHRVWILPEVQLSILRNIASCYEKKAAKEESKPFYDVADALAISGKYTSLSIEEFNQVLQQNGVLEMVDDPAVALYTQLYIEFEKNH